MIGRLATLHGGSYGEANGESKVKRELKKLARAVRASGGNSALGGEVRFIEAMRAVRDKAVAKDKEKKKAARDAAEAKSREMAFADARAKLRKEFRQRLSVGAWNDMFTHIFKRGRFINPTPAAEAKLLGEKMARNAASALPAAGSGGAPPQRHRRLLGSPLFFADFPVRRSQSAGMRRLLRAQHRGARAAR